MRTVILYALALMFSCLSTQAQAPPRFSFSEKSGPFAVGLKVVDQYDRSRDFLPRVDDLGKPETGDNARPLQTLIWYPAKKTTTRHMSVADYLALQTTETSFAAPIILAGLDEWLIEGVLQPSETATWAVRGAPLESGHFPIVIYAPSFESLSWENLDLCEYLASFGYVVISSPGMGVARESTHDVAGASAQARDISFLIGYAETLSDTDSSSIAVVGFSWGGLSNLFAAARDKRITALVALDGSMRYFPGLIQRAGDVHPDAMTIPLLFFEGRGSLEGQAQLESNFKDAAGPNTLNGWTHGDLLRVQMLGLIHPEFNSLSQRSERYWETDFAQRGETDIDRADGTVGYGWVARYTREFLDAYLRHDPSAIAFLKRSPAENSVPNHVMDANFRAAVASSFSFSDFRVQVGERGFDHLSDLYASTRLDHPSFSLDADTVTSWAYRLLGEHHFVEAIDTMMFAVQLQPSSRAYRSLGEVYARAGQEQPAIANYKKALSLDPDDIIAKQNLESLTR
jgi:pimeloyl-ACP methyl ester carboxylesterase